ncbi:type II toxin-antitoxin system RelE/ParE family toxin [Rhizobium laguerreae]|uniref:type II toxin-antitoxin system RelE/ParE family toxin n=1 Tax=Rhizobium laguerreae TaxID=1076926 RepID=UPI0028A69BE5|nr:type II toxin-antitoxin system RelE/ParE family toxin [Rhizobium laguerreae]
MKQTHFVGSSQDDIREFPEPVRREIGFAIFAAQGGGKAINVTPLVGFGGAGVLEIISNHDDGTYRAVYTVRFERAIYVLHAFKKKSVRRIKTPLKELNLVRERLKQAQAAYESEQASKKRRKNGRKTV